MFAKSERLNVLSEAELFALYGLPDFDESQRMDYFVFSEQELSLALNRPTVHAQLHCALQIGYFKAKQAFFLFSWEQTQEDTSFLRSRYFADQEFVPHLSPGMSIISNAPRSLLCSATVCGPLILFRCYVSRLPKSFPVM